MLRIVAIDRLRFAPFRAAADEYLGRLRRYVAVEERELKPSQGRRSDAEVRADESARLLDALPAGATYVVALDERGRTPTSPELARLLGRQIELARPIALLLGGALGHDESLRTRADLVLALSALTLPHELARVVLYEQLYRAMTILRGEPYHKS